MRNFLLLLVLFVVMLIVSSPTNASEIEGILSTDQSKTITNSEIITNPNSNSQDQSPVISQNQQQTENPTTTLPKINYFELIKQIVIGIFVISFLGAIVIAILEYIKEQKNKKTSKNNSNL